MYQKFIKTGSTAQRCSTMETRDHSKNGANPKSQNTIENLKFLLILILFFLVSMPAFTQPVNDQCPGSNLACSQTIYGNTAGATEKTGPWVGQASKFGVFYTFISNGEQVSLSTSGGSFIHKMGIYSGTCSNLTQIAMEQSSLIGGSNVATHTFSTVSGTQYVVYIAYYLPSGTITQTGEFTISKSCTEVPPNDQCPGATLVCGQTLSGTTAGTTEKTGPWVGQASKFGVFYTFISNGDQVSLSTSGGSFIHKMGIYSGTCSNLTQIAMVQSSLIGGSNVATHTFSTVSGIQYVVYIAYSLPSGTITHIGEFTISRSCIEVPINDQCPGSTLVCGQTLSGTTAGATEKTGPWVGQASKFGVFYPFVGDGEQTTLTSKGATFIHKMGIYSGACSNLTQIAMVQSSLSGGSNIATHTFSTVPGTQYVVYIAYYLPSGTITQTGEFTIEKSSICCTWPIGDPNYSSNVIAKLCNNTLTISGNGNMCDFWHSAEGEAPWWFNVALRNAIHNVAIENGVQNIGERAFKDCSNLQKITIPCSVTKINDQAFYNCCNIKEIHIACCSVPTLGNDCFSSSTLPTCKLFIPLCSCANEFSTIWGFPLSNIYAEGSATPCYTPTSYTISASAGENGTITPNGNISVSQGGSETFKFNPNGGYKIHDVKVDNITNQNAISDGEYTFKNVTANHTIHVTFTHDVGINSGVANQLQIFPNPTTGELRIESEELRINDIEIFDVIGKNVFTSQVSEISPEIVINISHLQSGFYFLRITTEAGEVVKKVLKE